MVGRWAENGPKLEHIAQLLPVHTLADHDLASFVVCLPVLDHIGALVDPHVPIGLQVDNKQKHQTLVVQKVLKSLEREFIQVVVDAHDLHFYECVVFEQLEHQLWIDQTS